MEMRPGQRLEGGPDMPDSSGSATVESPGADDAEVTDTPEIPEAVRDAARRAPGHWIGMVDPEWAQDRTPPQWAVLGEWQSDESGDVGDYRPNPAYRPSARVLG
ncbi:hypothetical protein ABZ879_35025, partial [Streptomyces chartreusis]